MCSIASTHLRCILIEIGVSIKTNFFILTENFIRIKFTDITPNQIYITMSPEISPYAGLKSQSLYGRSRKIGKS